MKHTKNETILDKVNQLKELAAKSNKTCDNLDTNTETALSRVIKTKEDGELFMKRLRALEL